MDTVGSYYFGLDIECEDIGGDNEDSDNGGGAHCCLTLCQ